MAATVTVRILEDGPRNAILWVEGNNGASGASPGTGGLDLAYQQLILPAQLGYMNLESKQRCQGLRLDKLEWDINAEITMRVDLFWDATTPSIAYSMIGRANKLTKDIGGIYSPPGLTGATGGLGISTSGAPGTLGAYTVVLHLVKLLPNP
jgi:hypothetical protein